MTLTAAQHKAYGKNANRMRVAARRHPAWVDDHWLKDEERQPRPM